MLLRTATALQSAAHRHLPPSLREFVKFGLVGSVGFVIDFSAYLVLPRLVGWTTVFTVLGYQIIAPNLVSVFLTVFAIFFFNKYWTFRDPRSEELARQGVRFSLVYLFTYILNQILTSFFTFRVEALRDFFGSKVDIAAKLLTVGFIAFLNFSGSKFFAFRRRRGAV